jgi:hypothetical protein
MQDVNFFRMMTQEYSELNELPSSNGRRFEPKAPDDEVNYFVVEDAGDLQIRCKDGSVYKAQAIRPY